MKILGILGSPVKRGTNYLLEEALLAAASEGAQTEILHVTDYDIKTCTGCNSCLKNNKCIIEDEFEEIAKKMIDVDGIIISSPSYFGTVSGSLKNLMDRSRFLKMDDYCLKDKFLGAISTSGLNHGGGQSTLETIYRFGLIHGMIVIGPIGKPKEEANMIIGTSEKDEGWRSIKKDEKARELAKSLGSRMVSLLK